MKLKTNKLEVYIQHQTVKTDRFLGSKLLLNQSIYFYIFLYHLNINFLIVVLRKIFVLKKYFYSILFFSVKRNFFINLKRKSNILYKKRFKRFSNLKRDKILTNECNNDDFLLNRLDNNSIFLKKKILVLNKYKKFCKLYLGIIFKSANNLFVWKFLTNNRKQPGNSFFILMLKNNGKFLINLKIFSDRRREIVFQKKVDKSKSLSRAILFSKKKGETR